MKLASEPRVSFRGAGTLLGFYLLFAAIIVLRRPDCLIHSQFWAEDGATFFPDAVQRSIWTNLASYNFGYFDLLLRLMHEVAALFPLTQAPRALAVMAILIQASVPAFLVSSRPANWMGAFPFRLIAALLYCAMPNSFEVHAIALHSRVHLAILASLIIVSRPAGSRTGRVFDLAILILSGLSGPFVFVLLPAAIWRFAEVRSATLRQNVIALALVLPFSLFAFLRTAPLRSGGSPLGASLLGGTRIIGGQFLLSLLLGERTYSTLLAQNWFTLAAWSGFVLFAILVAVLLLTGSSEIPCLLLIGLVLLAMALCSPLAATDRPQWLALWSVPGCGQRYYFPLMTALIFSAAAMASMGKYRWQRSLGFGLLGAVAIFGARVDFRLPPFTDYQFAERAEAYQNLAPGSNFVAQINPPGWKMELRK